jgi:septum formation protein
MKLILASASPRRAQILCDAGIRFDVLSADIDESRLPGEPGEAMVRRLAESKARAAWPRAAAAADADAAGEPCVVIGADTVVEIGGDVLGKPGTAEAARAMLQRLSGTRHRVLTGLAMLRVPDGAARVDVASTDVWFAAMTQDEIAEYVATGEPLDKAGAYGIQGFGGRFVERIDGCYFNVVGLPLALVYRTLKELGWRRD